MPLHVIAQAQDGIAVVAVLANHVGVGVMFVVVGTPPGITCAYGIPLIGLGMQCRIVHPVVLAVHHVVADFHILDDLGKPQGGGGGHEHWRNEAEWHHHPPCHFQAPVQADNLADVAGIPFAEIGEDLITNGVQVFFQFVELGFCQFLHDVLLVQRMVWLCTTVLLKLDVDRPFGYRNAELDFLFTGAGGRAGEAVNYGAAGFGAAALVADAHAAAVAW